MKIIFITTFCFLAIQAIPFENYAKDQLNVEWEKYKVQFEKCYHATTEASRRIAWEENLKHVQRHNLEYYLGKHTYTLGINEYSDMTHEEFKETYLGVESHHHNNITKAFSNLKANNEIPSSIDWRTRGYVTPVQKQGVCNCGYAFASLGALEGQHFKAVGELISLSKQQLVECSQSYGNGACTKGDVSKTFTYLTDNGVEMEEEYAYTGTVGTCKYDKSKVQVTPKGFRYVSTGRETDLADAVANIGPISANIDASLPSFKAYQSGIYNDRSCSSTVSNHAVLIVGYGVEDSKNYWLVKNSWGARWGVRGYIKILKDDNNLCGIATRASIPLL